ncbi:MAG TPA: hypothetical protein VF839_02835 [Clostridium sp.]
MRIALNFYLIFEIFIVILAVITYVFWDKRYEKNHGSDIPEGFEKTEEVIIDPSDERRLRVYYNSRTGERFYCEEKSN